MATSPPASENPTPSKVPESDPTAPENPNPPEGSQPGPTAEEGRAAPDPVAPVRGSAGPRRVRDGAVPFLLGAAAVVVVIALAGGTSWIVARAAAAEPPPAPTATAAPKAGGGMRDSGSTLVRGTVRSIDGDTWTVGTPAGASLTVRVGGTVRFLREGAAATASDFRVGDTVVVAGTRSGDTIDAKRVAVPKTRPSVSPTPDA